MGWALALTLHEVELGTYEVKSVVDDKDFKDHLTLAVHYRTWNYRPDNELGGFPIITDDVLGTHPCTEDDYVK